MTREDTRHAAVDQAAPNPADTVPPPPADEAVHPAAVAGPPPVQRAPIPGDRPAPPPQPATVHPRSPRKRLQAQQTGSGTSIRSQPLPAAPPAPRVAPPPLPDPVLPLGPWRWTRPAIVVAVVAWLIAVALLATTLLAQVAAGPHSRQVLLGAWAAAAFLTFAPLQWRLGLSGLAWQGVFGWTLLAALLAYAPPPTSNLLNLPEVPVYLLFFLAVFYAVASATAPLTFVVGQRVFRDRLQRLDARRARRQGYEAGLLLVAILGLSGLRVLTWWTGLLLLVVVLLLETLFLSQVPPEG